MKHFVIYISLSFMIISCKKKSEIENVVLETHTSKFDTIFEREWSIYHFNFEKEKKEEREEVELYISNQNDTISNQYIRFVDNKIDYSRSEFYDLKISKSEFPNLYKGKLKFYSNFNPNGKFKNRKTQLSFDFRQVTKDSSFFSNITVVNKNIIEFEFTNIEKKELMGLIIQNVEIDTIVNGEKMVRMIEIKKLVDFGTKTPNFCLEPFDFYKTNRFQHDKNRFTVIKK